MSGRYKTLKTWNEFPNGEQWLQMQKVKNTIDNAKSKRIALEQLDAFMIDNDINLTDLNNDYMDLFAVWLDDEAGLAHSTLSHRWYGVRSYLNAHIDPELGYLDDDDDYILEWIDKGTKTQEENDSGIHWIAQNKIQDLIDGAKNLKNRLVIQLLWNTGCRPSEVSRMKLRRVNRDQRSIKVKTSKVKNSNASNAERTVFYSYSMRDTMREWIDRGGRSQYPYADESEHLVVGYNTKSIGPRQINKIVRMAADNAGIQDSMIETAVGIQNNRVVPKTLRHSFAVHSVRGKELSGSPPIDIERLRRIMGHSSLDVTRQYLQYRESDIQTAYDRCFPQ